MKVYIKGKVLDKYTKVAPGGFTYHFLRLYQSSHNSFIDVLLRSPDPDSIRDFFDSVVPGSFALVSASVYPRNDGKKGFNVSAFVEDIVLSSSDVSDVEMKSLVDTQVIDNEVIL